MRGYGNYKILFFADGALCGKLLAFLDGELNPVEAENFRDHLSACDRCAIELEDALQLDLLADMALKTGDDVVAMPILRVERHEEENEIPAAPKRAKPRSC